MAQISSSTFNFIVDLMMNNNRPWFNDNKDRYLDAQANMADFAQVVLDELSKHDRLEQETGKKSLFRIYRDVRFSKDKSPYKSHLSGSFSRLGADRRGGFYFHIQPGSSFIGGGFWGPSRDDLLQIRKQIAGDAAPLRKVLRSKSFKDHFGMLGGDQLKTAPRDFPKDHPEIDLLRYKQFIVRTNFTDEQVLSPDFAQQVAGGFKAMLPFFGVMTEYLTTDLNGVSLLEG
ncbi:MAG: DUF2461 domain-containing protein [Bacteroidota bacterium]